MCTYKEETHYAKPRLRVLIYRRGVFGLEVGQSARQYIENAAGQLVIQ